MLQSWMDSISCSATYAGIPFQFLGAILSAEAKIIWVESLQPRLTFQKSKDFSVPPILLVRFFIVEINELEIMSVFWFRNKKSQN